MKKLIVLTVSSILCACTGSAEDYAAVYQIVPDAHVLYLGNHLFIARDNDGNTFLVKTSDGSEATSVDRVF